MSTFELAVYVSVMVWVGVFYAVAAIGKMWVESAYDDSDF